MKFLMPFKNQIKDLFQIEIIIKRLITERFSKILTKKIRESKKIILSKNNIFLLETGSWQQHKYLEVSILIFKIKQALHHIIQQEEKKMQSICQQDKLELPKFLEMNIMQIKMISIKEWLLHLLEIQEKLGCLLQVMDRVKLRILSKQILKYKILLINPKCKVKLQFQ